MNMFQTVAARTKLQTYLRTLYFYFFSPFVSSNEKPNKWQQGCESGGLEVDERPISGWVWANKVMVKWHIL